MDFIHKFNNLFLFDWIMGALDKKGAIGATWEVGDIVKALILLLLIVAIIGVTLFPGIRDSISNISGLGR